MFSLETFERHFCAVMEALVKAAVIELRRLLIGCSALGVSAQQRSAAAAGTAERGGKPEEGEDRRQQAVTHITVSAVYISRDFREPTVATHQSEMGQRSFIHYLESILLQGENMFTSRKLLRQLLVLPGVDVPEQFVSLMTSCTKSVLEQITVMVKVCETRPAEQKNDTVWTGAEPRNEELNSGSSSVRERDSVQKDSDASNAAEKLSFKCPPCEKTFARKCLMERHNLIHIKPHSCSECRKPFATRRGLNAHLQKHSGEKLYRCSDCGTEFAYKFTYRRHMRNHAAKKPTSHTCSLCELQFTDTSAFQRHRCEALKKTFVCSVCPETFQCRRSLADHENVHSGDRDFVCEICGDGFLSSSSLATHRVTHILKENCSDELDLGCSSTLSSHQNTREKLFSCEICGKRLSHKSALKHHMLIHTRERPYICEVCGKSCSHASALENHMRIHTGKKPGLKPVCGLCGKMFSSARSLRYHSSVHTGERAHACGQCEKRFSSPIILKAHMNIHSDEKKFGCNVCGRRFTQVSSLKLHRRLHTGEKLFHCIVCGKGFQHRTDFQKHACNHLPVEAGNGPGGKSGDKI